MKMKGVRHAGLVGLADFTGAIPPGHILLIGMGTTKGIAGKVFITRYPCTDAEDGRVLKVVQSKPPKMSDMDFDFLNALHFGGVVFGDPLPGHVPLPSLIAGGDLDGDLYVVCWDKKIVSAAEKAACGELNVRAKPEPDDEAPDEPHPWNDNWLQVRGMG
jgi:hypothetical protein